MPQCCLAKRNESQSKSAPNRRYSYTKVLDHRKHPIRGWCHNGNFVARITVETDDGSKHVRWVTLAANSAAEVQEEFRKLLVERSENRLRHIGRSSTDGEFYDQICQQRHPGPRILFGQCGKHEDNPKRL